MSELVERESSNIQHIDSSPARLVEIAINQNADIDKLEKLMAMQERYDATQAKKAYVLALVDFQKDCPTIKKRKSGHNYLYAPLSDIIAQIKAPLSKYGLAYRFEQSEVNGQIQITCHITHKDGHSETTSMTGNPDTSGSKNVIQSYGSTVTYLQRYTLTGALGITTADEDIDGRLDSDVDWQGELGKLITQMECVRDNFDEIYDIKSKIANDDHVGAKLDWGDLGRQAQETLWLAPSKGGVFTTDERKSIKETSVKGAA